MDLLKHVNLLNVDQMDVKEETGLLGGSSLKNKHNDSKCVTWDFILV